MRGCELVCESVYNRYYGVALNERDGCHPHQWHDTCARGGVKQGRSSRTFDFPAFHFFPLHWERMLGRPGAKVHHRLTHCKHWIGKKHGHLCLFFRHKLWDFNQVLVPRNEIRYSISSMRGSETARASLICYSRTIVKVGGTLKHA